MDSGCKGICWDGQRILWCVMMDCGCKSVLGYRLWMYRYMHMCVLLCCVHCSYCFTVSIW